LAHLANHTNLCTATIATYRSALSTYHVESQYGDQINPIDNPQVHRIMLGVKLSRAPIEKLIRQEKAANRPDDVTFELLHRIERIQSDDSSKQIMCWAATCLGTYAFLRIGEMVHSTRNSDRYLTPNHIQFFMQPDSITPTNLLPLFTTFSSTSIYPDHFILTLGVTKTDQLGVGIKKPIAARIAVRALWRWYHKRRDIIHLSGTIYPELFRLPGEYPLTAKDIFTFVMNQTLNITTGQQIRVEGKSFRRGGASSYVGAAISTADTAAAGGWKSLSMVNTYTDPKVKTKRALDISRDL